MDRMQQRFEVDDVAVGLDLGGERHSVVVLSSAGQRLTSFEIPHSVQGFEELLRRVAPTKWGPTSGRAIFAFEATGHVWEALAHFLADHEQPYALVNPLATFRVREARQMGRDKRDVTDAEQVAELLRTGLVIRTQLGAPTYVALRRGWGEYVRLRGERARLKTLAKHQLSGAFPELARVWKDLFAPGPLAVLRTGLTPSAIAALPFPAFWQQVLAMRHARRIWQFKVRQVHERAGRTVAAPHGMAALMRELQRIVARVDVLTAQMASLTTELQALLDTLEEARYLATIPGLGWVSITGMLAEIGAIDRFDHGRQLVKLAGLNPGRRESGTLRGRTPMTRRGRAGLRAVVYMATVSCIQHNPRLRAHYDRLVQRPQRPLPKMQALGACMTKLLLYAFAVTKRRQPFNADHQWGVRPAAAA